MFVILSLLFVLTPTVYIFFFQTGTQYPRAPIFYLTLYGLVFLTLFSLLRSKKIQFNINLSLVDILVIGFWLIHVISTFFSISQVSSIFGIWTHTQGGLFFVTGLVMFYFYFKNKANTHYVKNFFTLSTLGIITTLLWGYFFYESGPKFEGVFIRPSFTEYNPIYYSIYIALGIPFSISLFFYYKNLWLKNIFFLLALLISTAVILTLTRGVWIAAIGAILFFFIGLYLKMKPKLLRLFFSPYFLSLILAMILTTYFLYPVVSDKVASTVSDAESENSVNLRISEYQSALEITKDNLLLGTGPDTVYYSYPQYRNPELNNSPREWLWSPFSIRNYYLQISSTIGTGGLVIFLSIIAVSILENYRRLKAKTLDENFILSLGLTSSFVLIFIHFFSYSTTFTINIFFWTILSLLQTNENQHFKVLSIKFPRPLQFICFILLLFLIPTTLYFFYSDFKARSLYKESSQKRSEYKALDLTQEAINTNPYVLEYKKQFAFLVAGKVIANLYYNQFTLENKKDLETAQIYLEDVRKVDPKDPTLAQYQSAISYSFYRAAKIQKKKDRTLEYEKALKDALYAHELNPTRPDILDMVTLVYLDADGSKLKEAEETAKKTISLRPEFSHAWHHLGESLKQQARFEESIKAYEQSLTLDPEDSLSKKQIEDIKKLIKN